MEEECKEGNPGTDPFIFLVLFISRGLFSLFPRERGFMEENTEPTNSKFLVLFLPRQLFRLFFMEERIKEGNPGPTISYHLFPLQVLLEFPMKKGYTSRQKGYLFFQSSYITHTAKLCLPWLLSGIKVPLGPFAQKLAPLPPPLPHPP
jgi:hypothetical protein